MPDYQIAVVCPNQKHIVTPQEIEASNARLDQAFATIKADGQLPKSATLRQEIGFAGVASPTLRSSFYLRHIPGIGETSFTVDPQTLACMTVKEDQSVLLHETGHMHEPVITSLFLVAAYVSTTGIQGLIGAPFKMTKRARRRAHLLSVMNKLPDQTQNISEKIGVGAKSVLREFKQSGPKLVTRMLQWTLGGLAFIYAMRMNEAYADLYAAQNMGSPNYVQSTMSIYPKMQLFLVAPEAGTGAPDYKPSVQLHNNIRGWSS